MQTAGFAPASDRLSGHPDAKKHERFCQDHAGPNLQLTANPLRRTYELLVSARHPIFRKDAAVCTILLVMIMLPAIENSERALARSPLGSS